MINISSIKTHMFCPMNLYIQTYLDNEENNNYQLAVEIKKLKIDILDLIQKNMRKIKKEMTIAEIENELSENIDSFIESNTNAIISMDLALEESQVNEKIPLDRPYRHSHSAFLHAGNARSCFRSRRLPCGGTENGDGGS